MRVRKTWARRRRSTHRARRDCTHARVISADLPHAASPAPRCVKEGAVIIEGSVHVPLNKDGVKQSDDPTTSAEFAAKAGGALPADKATPIITHCGRGGRGNKAKLLLEELGYTQVINGGSPEYITAVRAD